MCESKLYEISEQERKLVMEDVIKIVIDDDRILAMDILGNQKEIKGRLKEVNLGSHEIIVISDPRCRNEAEPR